MALLLHKFKPLKNDDRLSAAFFNFGGSQMTTRPVQPLSAAAKPLVTVVSPQKRHLGPAIFWLLFIWGYLLISSQPSLAQAFRAPRDHQSRLQAVRTVYLMPFEINMHEIQTDGKKISQKNWAQAARKNLAAGITEALKRKGYRLAAPPPMNKALKNEIWSVRALYRAVNHSIKLHTYGPQIYPTKLENFDYSLGPIDELLNRVRADALVFVFGTGEMGASKFKTDLSIGLAEKSGDILWYNYRQTRDRFDLRDAAQATDMVKETIGPLPGGAK